ncbi:XRE family transcriptional regulator [Streptomyces phaeolivaceus]|uniref:XRE family transcriptional regulator n=1 Tax=Streptomyces phaeolivaceus TaxID=2653200 RepID=A0A5P8KAH8_9ACTN|nr:XRE family transcriptional regulator [Streptomyces phaeolivaceus]QFR00314.1 XRE family transcriptional regulator [Streptomyces phaeolivaceus]
MTATVEAPVQPGQGPQQPYALQSANTPMGRVRVARGWSQEKVVRALTLLAENWGWQIASESSLKVQLSRWEHDVTRPGETYRVLLCAVYRATPDELGFNRPRPAKAPLPSQSLRDRVSELEARLEMLTSYLSMSEGLPA